MLLNQNKNKKNSTNYFVKTIFIFCKNLAHFENYLEFHFFRSPFNVTHYTVVMCNLNITVLINGKQIVKAQREIVFFIIQQLRHKCRHRSYISAALRISIVSALLIVIIMSLSCPLSTAHCPIPIYINSLIKMFRRLMAALEEPLHILKCEFRAT